MDSGSAQRPLCAYRHALSPLSLPQFQGLAPLGSSSRSIGMWGDGREGAGEDMLTDGLDFQEVRAQNKEAWPENGCGRGERQYWREAQPQGTGRRAQERQDWLTPDMRDSCLGPEARSSDLLRFRDSKRQSPEHSGPGPGPGMPADPGWMAALETAFCSGQSPAGVTLEDL